eukprot:2031602-Pyramimonas_sp.AAC.1
MDSSCWRSCAPRYGRGLEQTAETHDAGVPLSWRGTAARPTWPRRPSNADSARARPAQRGPGTAPANGRSEQECHQ